MFAEKLQNPFLKPSPFTSSNASYNPYPTAPRFPSYNSYQQPKYSLPTNYAATNNNQYTTHEHNYPSFGGRQQEHRDIDAILSSNPFTRQQPSFSYSRTSDLSPAKTNLLDRPAQSYDNYNSNPHSSQLNRSAAGSLYPQTHRRPTPTKKYDNYLNTSSADSATTYINKIYDLEDDRLSVNEPKFPSTNPFHRKNLLERNTEKTPPTNNSYDTTAMRYMSYKYEENKQKQRFDGNNDYEKNYPNDRYQANYPPKNSTNYPPQKNSTNFYRGVSFGQAEQQYVNYLEKYDPKPSHQGFDTEDIYTTSKFPYGSMGYQQKRPGSNPYSFKDILAEDEKYQYDYKMENKYSTNSNGYNYQSSQPNRPSQQSKASRPSDPKYYENKFNTQEISNNRKTSSFQNPYTEYEGQSKKQIYYKHQQNKIKFNESSEEESSKYQSYKGYQENFDTLNPYPPKPRAINQSKHSKQPQDSMKNFREPHRLTSSQVDEYTHPQDIESKLKQNRYKQLGIERQSEKLKPRSSTKIVTFDQNEEDVDRVASKKGRPSRDTRQEYPKQLQYNGVLFHRVEL